MLGTVTVGSPTRNVVRPRDLAAIPGLRKVIPIATDQIPSYKWYSGEWYGTQRPIAIPNFEDERNTYLLHGRRLSDLPYVGALDTVGSIGQAIRAGTVSRSEVNRANQEIEFYAQQAAFAERKLAQMNLSAAQRAQTAAQAQLSRFVSAPAVGDWWSEAKKKAEQVAAAAKQAAQAAAAAAAAAATQAANAAKAAAKQTAHAVVVNTNNAKSAVSAAVNSAKTFAANSVANLKKQINKLVKTPLQRIKTYMVALPPPANFAAALAVAKKHKAEVIAELPSAARSFLTKLDAQMESLVSGLRGSIGQWPITIAWLGVDQNVGALSWETAKKRISDAWYHKLSAGQRRTLVGVLIVLAILTIIVAIYVPGGVGAAIKGDWAAIKLGFAKFAEAVGWEGIVGLFGAILAWFKGAPGAPPVPPANDPVANPPAQPSPAETKVTADAIAEEENDGIPAALKVAGAAALAFIPFL